MRTCSFLCLIHVSTLVYGADGASAQKPIDVPDTMKIAEQNYSMFDLMKSAYRPDEIVRTEEEAFEYSPVVIRGFVDSITEGRSIIDTQTLTRTPQNTALIKVEVSEVLKGSVGEYVYFEYMSGALPAETLDAAKYLGEVLLYLRDAFEYPHTFEVTHSARGLMHEVDKLYLLTSTSLFFTQNEKLGAEISSRNAVEIIQKHNSSADPDPDSVERLQLELE